MPRLPLVLRRMGAELVGSVPVRITGGPNEGLKWSLASSGRGYRTGRFEHERVSAITGLLRPGDRFWDIGAHKGYVGLAAARAVAPGGEVVAFEPSTINRGFLERHVRWNAMASVRVLPFAISDADGEARFGGSGSSITYQLGRGPEVVPTRTIRSLVEKDGLRPPTVLKIDAEGSEGGVLRGGLEYLAPGMLVWISVHGWELYRECRELLEGRGFRVYESAIMAAKLRAPDAPWGGDKELLAVGPERGVGEAEIRALPLFRV